MAKKIKKSKGRGRKPKVTVSSKEEATPYDRARAALSLKYEEDSYQKVMGNIDGSRNVLQEYLDAYRQLESYENQKQGYQTNEPTTKEKVKQTQDEPRLAA